MPYHSNANPSQQPLRQQAEGMFQNRQVSPQTFDVSQTDLQRLVHALHVHQVELELQNQALRRSQQESLAARDQDTALYDFAPVGYLTLDDSDGILEVNLTAATMLDVVRSKLLGMRFTRFVSRDDQDTFYLHRRRVMEHQVNDICDMEIQRADGTAFWGRLEALAVDHTAGHPVEGYRMILSDMTALKQADHNRQQAERLISLGTFAAGLAHELNNPLYAISSTAEYAREALAKKTYTQADIDDCLVDILSDAGRCTQLVKNVLNFARQGSREKVLLDLHPLIQSSSDLTQRYDQEHGVLICLRFAHAPPRIVANRVDIRTRTRQCHSQCCRGQLNYSK